MSAGGKRPLLVRLVDPLDVAGAAVPGHQLASTRDTTLREAVEALDEVA